MANRNFASAGKIYSMHTMPVAIDCNVAIGTSGATSDLIGPLVTSVTRVAVGTYKIVLSDTYNKLFNTRSSLKAPVTGSAIAGGSFVASTVYQIVSLGTTNYHLVGLPAGVTQAVGQVFVASGIGAGTGTVKALGNSGISSIELIGSMEIDTANMQSIIFIQTLAPTSSSVTTMIPADPASGSRLYIDIYLSNSSVVIAGE